MKKFFLLVTYCHRIRLHKWFAIAYACVTHTESTGNTAEKSHEVAHRITDDDSNTERNASEERHIRAGSVVLIVAKCIAALLPVCVEAWIMLQR